MNGVDIKWLNIGVMGGLGFMSAFLANKTVAVFHDGLRPILPEYFENRMDRKSLAAASFALSIGLIIGYGYTNSLATTMIVAHSILLAGDFIGVSFPNNKKGALGAGLTGSLYSIALMFLLRQIAAAFQAMPVNFFDALSKVGDPIITAFAVFPALVIAGQFGVVKGYAAFIVTIFVIILTYRFGSIPVGSAIINLNPIGMALLVSMGMMMFFATREKNQEEGSNSALLGFFSERIKRIKNNIFLIAVAGGFCSAAISLRLFSAGPIQTGLLAKGYTLEAGLFAVASAVGYVTLVGTTAIATGVYSPVGMKFVFVTGSLLINPWFSFLAGFTCIILEILCLDFIAKTLDYYPGIKTCSEQIRSSMTKVLEMALMVGSMIAANAIFSYLGFFFVTGMYLINRFSKKPFMTMALGPISVIFLGILMNIMALLGLYIPPVK